VFLSPIGWLHNPQHIMWPTDVGELVSNAMPDNAKQYVGLVGGGHYAEDR
jgi:hypothetical protein